MIRALFILVFGTLFFTSLTTPAVLELLKLFFDPFPWPFSRVYDRVAMLWALIFLILFRREFPLKALLSQLKSPTFLRSCTLIIIGIFVTLIPSLFLVPYYVDGEVFTWKPNGLQYALAKLPKVILGALVVSVIEEGFFRFIFYEKCKKHLPLLLAVLASSLLYAFVHFIAPVKSWQYPGFSLTIGFEYLLAVGERMGAPGVLPAAFGLFLVGSILCAVIQRTGSLYLCIGMHAGWVMAIKIASAMTIVSEGYTFTLGAGRRYFLVSEPVSWVLVLFIGLFVVSGHRFLFWQRKDD